MDGIKQASGVSRREFLAGVGAFVVAPPRGEIEDLCFLGPGELARRIRTGELSVRDVMEAHLARIERVNPKVNAICTLVAERALDEARRKDANRPKTLPPLYGLPVAIKDLVLTKGIRTTFGSRIFKDFVPDHDALHVERLKAAGAIIVGKTNVPEFGAGSQTYNEVFGETRNPYDLTKTCGGSSGGAAVALACGMVPLADGSDLGGSLRNPASFCNVVGFRPSPGRVPALASGLAWQSLAVLGPMGRRVEDAALLLSVMAGHDDRAPASLPGSGEVFRRSLARDFQGARIAWSPDLGRYPVEKRVVDVCTRALDAFRTLGCRVEEDHPDFSDVDEIFQTFRAWMYAWGQRDNLKEHRELLKDTVIWNAEKGLPLTGLDLAEAESKRAALYLRVATFLERYDFLVLPVSQVAPFPVEVRWVREIEGVRMKTYIDWMASCYAITVTGLPAISVPAGFTADGLPIGLQIVGRHQRDFEVLQMAHAFESVSRVGERRPAIALS